MNNYAIIDTATGVTVKYGIKARTAKEVLKQYQAKDWVIKNKLKLEVMTCQEYLHSIYY